LSSASDDPDQVDVLANMGYLRFTTAAFLSPGRDSQVPA
jgi:hypothetical protein